jgi:hypothetical protein
MKPIPAENNSARTQQVSTKTTLDDFGSEGIPAPAF